MGLSPKSNYEKKKSFLVLTSGKFLEALGSGFGTGSIFCLSFSLLNRVLSFQFCARNENCNGDPSTLLKIDTHRTNSAVSLKIWGKWVQAVIKYRIKEQFLFIF